MKVLVTTSPRSGTHFMVRSLGLSLGVPVAVKPNIDKLPIEDHWVVGTHVTDILDNCPEDVVKIGVHREMLGHLLSYFDHPEDPNSNDFIEKVRQSDFFVLRKKFLNLDINYFSYDKITKKDDVEINRLSGLFGMPIKFESYANITKAINSVMFRHGDPDRWKKVFSKKTQDILVAMSEETK
jgi:hypothetical protein